jgi:hypothetical protein
MNLTLLGGLNLWSSRGTSRPSPSYNRSFAAFFTNDLSFFLLIDTAARFIIIGAGLNGGAVLLIKTPRS